MDDGAMAIVALVGIGVLVNLLLEGSLVSMLLHRPEGRSDRGEQET